MYKIGASTKASGSVWDAKGKSKIAEIYIASNKKYFRFIDFVYGDNQNTPRLSGLSCQGDITFFNTITLEYPFEFINGISGFYERDYGSKYLRSITFHTNKAKYGPFIACPANEESEQIEFNYQVGSNFSGFFGTNLPNGVESIGIYCKPA
ncbi:Jacalin-type lectin domain-containing protein [Heracleum sosnowskyi]|uniref:Jacalin-type lectin domain-containing protein n=1 Tax=Heracleum sosnowskyi TaxID=360622 RepID=A0AAD8ISN9_9APIA|nr:Jacalin-type lectin domain-containing protein [Heracleum sosnowskyi]